MGGHQGNYPYKQIKMSTPHISKNSQYTANQNIKHPNVIKITPSVDNYENIPQKSRNKEKDNDKLTAWSCEL
ncbi:MAG: hypothetical protein IJ085_00685 [Turicibacter sp.]|nr:hypothetical protein [Turicibacter sp.]